MIYLKEQNYLKFIQIICLIGLFSSFAGCVSEDNSENTWDELVLKTQEVEQYNLTDSPVIEENNDSEEKSSSVAGTCPFGNNCCGSAGCSLWVDSDNDGCCDRGVVTE
ncbi:MAG: hypothetical protein U9N40_05730 [Euryarchaeota archaeon]|nr:hypothetical protein [Euryarchaeota archaeon]